MFMYCKLCFYAAFVTFNLLVKNAIINQLLGEGFIKIGSSFPKLYKFQNTDDHGTTFLMGKMEI